MNAVLSQIDQLPFTKTLLLQWCVIVCHTLLLISGVIRIARGAVVPLVGVCFLEALGIVLSRLIRIRALVVDSVDLVDHTLAAFEHAVVAVWLLLRVVDGLAAHVRQLRVLRAVVCQIDVLILDALIRAIGQLIAFHTPDLLLLVSDGEAFGLVISQLIPVSALILDTRVCLADAEALLTIQLIPISTLGDSLDCLGLAAVLLRLDISAVCHCLEAARLCNGGDALVFDRIENGEVPAAAVAWAEELLDDTLIAIYIALRADGFFVIICDGLAALLGELRVLWAMVRHLIKCLPDALLLVVSKPIALRALGELLVVSRGVALGLVVGQIEAIGALVLLHVDDVLVNALEAGELARLAVGHLLGVLVLDTTIICALHAQWAVCVWRGVAHLDARAAPLVIAVRTRVVHLLPCLIRAAVTIARRILSRHTHRSSKKDEASALHLHRWDAMRWWIWTSRREIRSAAADGMNRPDEG
mmetsp:Transcript_8412/g.20582  ORF Transcript_8412/g.20582 Transcript_8412/m.20582 type:complete len:473 (-) Transcript_8412:67-1485(-)